MFVVLFGANEANRGMHSDDPTGVDAASLSGLLVPWPPYSTICVVLKWQKNKLREC